MPITFAGWSSNRDLDLHILQGQSGPDLSASHLAFRQVDNSRVWAQDYLNNPANGGDVTLTFRPQIAGTLAGTTFRGGGVQIDTTTGVVTVDNLLPPLHLHNFIVVADVVNTADGAQYLLPIRFHIHRSLSQVWLTPPTLTIRPDGSNRPDETGYRFSVHAQFDDGTVGDLTEGHGITWGPAANVHTNTGKIFLTIFDAPGATLTVTATLPAALGGGSVNGTASIVEPWGVPNFASLVVGGGWPGMLNPDVVPNFLFLADGFAPVDSGAFEQLAASIVHRFKTSKLTTPFDLLATSMNFWRVFIPSTVRGISVLCEVYTVEQGGERRGYMVPNAKQPPAAGAWSLENVVYAAGLPIATDLPSHAARTNADIRAEWAVLLNPDPSPNVPDALLNQWRRLGNRSLVEEKDTPLGMAYGSRPQVVDPTDDLFVDFHPDRLNRGRLDLFLSTIRGDQGHDLRELWAAQGATRPPNYDFVFIYSACKWDRGHNADGYIAMNVDESPFLRGLSTVAGRSAYQWDPPPPPTSITALRSGRALHEIAHSYGLGDEYADQDGAFTGTAGDLERYGNLQLDTDAQIGGVIHGDAIKWNWYRARKGALLRDAPTSSGGNRWLVQLQPGHGLQFGKGDKVILRKRPYPRPLVKDPVESAVLEIDDPRDADTVTVVGVLNPDVNFVEGDVLYMPRPAPDSVRSDSYPFAEMVAKNIKDFITGGQRPLTPVPCSPAEAQKDVQDPILNGVSLPICFRDKPRIIGLYHGGRSRSCGIFHPAGTCMMHGGQYDSLEFCAVCRYVLVEIIDPFKHFQNDLKYDDFYPQR